MPGTVSHMFKTSLTLFLTCYYHVGHCCLRVFTMLDIVSHVLIPCLTLNHVFKVYMALLLMFNIMLMLLAMCWLGFFKKRSYHHGIS